MFINKIGVLFALFCVCICAAGPVTANEESTATADETVAWLKGVLSQKFVTSLDKSGQWEMQVVKIDRKTLVYREKMTAFPRGVMKGHVLIHRQVIVPLSSIDPLTIEPAEVPSGELTYGMVQFRTSRSRAVIVEIPLANHYEAEKKPEYMSYNALRVSSIEWAERIARALRHLVKLAGGEVDPF